MTQATYELALLLALISDMKNDYFDKAISFESLYKSLKKCCRNVRWKNTVVKYEDMGLLNTLNLSNSLKDGTYKISDYQKFKIFEPKERDIVAARIVDRQFQRSLCDSGLYDDFVEHFIQDNVACQKGKGGDYAIKRLKTHLGRYFRRSGNKNKGWVLKCDVHHFFPETDHEIAKETVVKYIDDINARKAVCDLIDSFDGDKGIGLGSQISQLLQLALLSDLDHFIKERLCIKYYVRYMDDFVLIHENKEHLKYCWKEIEDFLKEKKLQLNKKTSLYPLEQGIVFLKWRIVLSDTGKIYQFTTSNKVAKQKKKMRKLYEREKNGLIPAGSTYESTQSFLANLSKGDTRNQVLHIERYYAQLTGRSIYDK